MAYYVWQKTEDGKLVRLPDHHPMTCKDGSPSDEGWSKEGIVWYLEKLSDQYPDRNLVVVRMKMTPQEVEI